MTLTNLLHSRLVVITLIRGNYFCNDFVSGAVFQLVNPTTNNTFGEGETVNVCAELVNNGGGLRRSISLHIFLLSGTATRTSAN